MLILTIRFDPEDRDQPSPFFNLESAGRTWISSGDLCGTESQLLMFLHAPNEPACREFLSTVLMRQSDYGRKNARLVVIFPVEVSAITDFAHDPKSLLALADPDREVRRRYAALMADHLVQDQDVMLFVMDENGGIYVCLVGSEPDPGAQDEILSWLDFIGIQCPE